MRVELQVGDVIRYDSSEPGRSFYLVYLGDGFYFRDGEVRRNRKKLHKIAASLSDGKPGRFFRFKKVDT